MGQNHLQPIVQLYMVIYIQMILHAWLDIIDLLAVDMYFTQLKRNKQILPLYLRNYS